jgi:Protein of unknown function (DUF4238)
MALASRNHFVPELYLKRFASSSGTLQMYRTLVSIHQVPLWKSVHVGGVGYHLHLYTRLALGQETDEVETWLNRDFETPAEAPLRKAAEGDRLTPTDWEILVRFVAAQIVRTPAFLAKNLPMWQERMPGILNNIMEELPRRLTEIKESGVSHTFPYSDYIPLVVKKNLEPDGQAVRLRSEVVVGRGMWLFAMKHLLGDETNTLHLHRWTILHAPDGLEWFTSDDPVIRVNYSSNKGYDFEGGWNSDGSMILLPLSPRHILYTQVGHRPPPRGSVLSQDQARQIRGFIAEHAHRQIFSSHIDRQIPVMRPRVVNAEAMQREKEGWEKWPEQQDAAERKLRSGV